MIQFKRGSSESWKKQKTPLAAGQPGYDKDKHKLKVGDGVKLWDKLPYASISEEEVLDSEKNAKTRLAADPESLAIITYGSEGPTKDTVGRLYLQYRDSEPEVDYVVSYGTNKGWTYRKWYSGLAECYGTFKISTSITSEFDNVALFYNSNAIDRIGYPFKFKKIPTETATLSSSSSLVWLASSSINTESSSASYKFISPTVSNRADYSINITVKGHWK